MIPLRTINNINFYSCAEVGESIGVSEATVRAYVRSGLLAAKKVGRSYAISEDNLQRFVGARFGIAYPTNAPTE